MALLGMLEILDDKAGGKTAEEVHTTWKVCMEAWNGVKEEMQMKAEGLAAVKGCFSKSCLSVGLGRAHIQTLLLKHILTAAERKDSSIEDCKEALAVGENGAGEYWSAE